MARSRSRRESSSGSLRSGLRPTRPTRWRRGSIRSRGPRRRSRISARSSRSRSRRPHDAVGLELLRRHPDRGKLAAHRPGHPLRPRTGREPDHRPEPPAERGLDDDHVAPVARLTRGDGGVPREATGGLRRNLSAKARPSPMPRSRTGGRSRGRRSRACRSRSRRSRVPSGRASRSDPGPARSRSGRSCRR